MSSILYYIALFVIALLIRTFKILPGIKSKEFKWYEFLNVGLEIVFTASGLVAALMLELGPEWISPVFTCYFLIVIASAFVELSPIVPAGLRTVLNIIFIGTTTTAMIWAYSTVLKDRSLDGKSIGNRKQNFKIIIPYIDESLARHVGYGRLNEKPFQYTLLVSDSLPEEAINKAIMQIQNDSLIKPLYSLSSRDIVINRSAVVAIPDSKSKSL